MDDHTANVLVAKAIAVTPFTQLKAQVQTSEVGLIFIDLNVHVAQLNKVRVSNGVAEVPCNRSFTVLLSSFGAPLRMFLK